MATLTFVVKLANENGISYWFVTAGLSVTDTNTETNTDKVKYKCRWKYKTKTKSGNSDACSESCKWEWNLISVCCCWFVGWFSSLFAFKRNQCEGSWWRWWSKWTGFDDLNYHADFDNQPNSLIIFDMIHLILSVKFFVWYNLAFLVTVIRY